MLDRGENADFGAFLSAIARSCPDRLKALAEAVLPQLGTVEVVQSRTGLVMLPFLNGERTPDLPQGKGVLAGLDTTNLTAAHLYRASVEGATYSLKYGFDAFLGAGMAFERIVLTGGGSNSAAWRQLVADVFGLQLSFLLPAICYVFILFFGVKYAGLYKTSPKTEPGHL